jgi:excisionase family DNA binding protein
VAAAVVVAPATAVALMSVWLTVAQVAEQESVSARTILRWIETGHLRARRQPGGRLRVHADWYREMVEQGDAVGRMLAAVGDAREERP